MLENDLLKLLAARYSGKEWVFLTQVRNGTGYARGVNRTADALAMSVWPSRGLSLSGFEVKVSRSDWLREKKDPAKAEEIAAFCDYWWLVVSEANIVQPGELPETWGLLVPDGAKLAVVVEAKKLQPKPLDRLMLASIFRCVADGTVPRCSIADEIAAARKAGQEQGRDQQKYAVLEANRELKKLQDKVEAFKKSSGIDIAHINSWDVAAVGHAAKYLADGLQTWELFNRPGSGLDAAMNLLRGVLRSLEKTTAELSAVRLPLAAAPEDTTNGS